MYKAIATALSAFLAMAAFGPSQAQETFKVGTNANGAPWSFHDADSNRERGISVELMVEIGKDAGFRVEFVPMTISELIPALNANKIDIVAANLLVTPARSQLVDFSEAIAPGGDGLIVPKIDATPYTSIQEIKGLSVGVQAGSPFADIMQKSGLFPDLKLFPSGGDAMRAVSAGAIQAAVVGVNGAAYDMKLGRFPDLRLVDTYRPMVASVDAFSVRKGDSDLLQRINSALARLRASGSVEQILDRYGQRTR